MNPLISDNDESSSRLPLDNWEPLLRDALDAVSDGIWDIDIPSWKTTQNAHSLSLFGFDPNQPHPNSDAIFSRIYPDDWPRVKKALDDHIQGKIPRYECEFRVRWPDGRIRWVMGRGKVVQWDEDGKPQTILGTNIDITSQKRLEESLEIRLASLTHPVEQAGKINFEELFDLATIQRIQDEFADATGVASIITHPDGTPITRPSNFTRLCENIIRKTEAGLKNCFKSDAIIGSSNIEGPTIQPCLSCGLWDAGASILVAGQHVANWLIGQVRDDSQTQEQMRQYAQAIGADEEAFIQAFQEVPRMPKAQFEKVAQSLYTLANQLSATAYQNIQQARMIHELRKAEERIKKSEATFRSYIENSPDMILIFNAQGRFKDVNPTTCELTGHSRQAILGMSIPDMLAPESMEAGLMSFEHLKDSSSFSGEVNLLHQDGRSIPVEVKATDLGDGLYIAFCNDITDRKLSEIKIHRETQFTQTALDAQLDTFFVFEPATGRAIRWNQAFKDISGYSDKEISRLPAPDAYYDDDDLERTKSFFQKVFKEGGGTIELTLVCKDGRRVPTEYQVSLINDERGESKYFISVGRDVTQQKLAQREHMELEEQLRQSQKIESVGRLAGGIAHDLNNLLTPVLGYGDMLLGNPSIRGKQRDYITEIVQAGERARDLVSQLLTFSRKQEVCLESINPNDVVTHFEKLLRHTLREDIHLDIVTGPDLPNIMGDSGQLEQVLMNLAINAQDAMPDGGTLRIQTDSVVLDKNFIKAHSNAQPGQHVRLRVSDTGHGMDDETLKHAFEPFFTTKELGKGTGLGLSMVYGILQQHSAVVDLKSVPEAGTTFDFYFPSCRPMGQKQQPDTEVSTELASSGTILLVEDEAIVRNLTRQLLEKLGYTVLVAEDANEALGILKHSAMEIELLLTDIIMPGLSGKDLSDQVRQHYPHIKILFMSGYSADVLSHHQAIHDDIQLLYKPFTRDTLARKIRDALEK